MLQSGDDRIGADYPAYARTRTEATLSFRKSELPRSKSRKLERFLLLDEVSNEINDSYAPISGNHS
jgi:hypothetical protein